MSSSLPPHDPSVGTLRYKCKGRSLTTSHRLRLLSASFLPLETSNKPLEGSTDSPREILPCTLSPSSSLVSLPSPVTCCKLLSFSNLVESILIILPFSWTKSVEPEPVKKLVSTGIVNPWDSADKLETYPSYVELTFLRDYLLADALIVLSPNLSTDIRPETAISRMPSLLSINLWNT